MRILWVEDDARSAERINSWFGECRVENITDFTKAEAAIQNNLSQYDVAVLDINLENSNHEPLINRAKALNIDTQEFLESSGMNLFLTLLEQGFPKEQIIFLTGNANNNSFIDLTTQIRHAKSADDIEKVGLKIEKILSDEQNEQFITILTKQDNVAAANYIDALLPKENSGNTYEKFRKAYQSCRINAPDAISKSGAGLAQEELHEWLETHEQDPYITLRRGIIDGCRHLSDLIQEDSHNIRFQDFIALEKGYPKREVGVTDMLDYLNVIAHILPVKQHVEKKPYQDYRLLLRTLAHEWEDRAHPENLDNSPVNLKTFAWIMKLTRNWAAHGDLLDPFSEKDIAFLFLLNMRVMFKLPTEIVDYEKQLLKCFGSGNENLDTGMIQEDINYAKQYVEEIAAQMDIDHSFFRGRIREIYRVNSNNPDAEEFNFKQFLFQLFWIEQNRQLSMFCSKDSNEFIPMLAKHIYEESFSR